MAGPALFRPGDITSGLQGYWKLGEASGTRSDSSGNSNDLTDNNTVTEDTVDYWGLGEGAADFESGNTEYLSIADASQTGLDLTGSFTMAAWVKFETLQSQGIMGKGGVSNYVLAMNAANKIELSAGSTQTTDANALVANRWYHLAVVHDTTNNIDGIFIDGNLVAVATNSNDPSNDANPFVIGNTLGYANTLDGRVKDAAVWSAALTPLQIKSLAMGVDLSEKAYRPDNPNLASGLVSYWKLNELGNPAANFNRNDSIGSNHLSASNVVPSGVGFCEGIGAHFDGDPHGGVLDYLSISDASQSGLDQDSADAAMTFCVWIKPDALESTDGIAGKVLSNADNEGWVVGTGSNGRVFFQLKRGTLTEITAPTGTVRTGVWYHIAAVYDPDADAMYLYVDGKLQASGTHTYGIGDHAGAFILGCNSGAVSGADFFSGDMSDAAFWTRALSASEVKRLAQAFDYQQAQLVSYWKLDEGSGTRIDTIGANDLTDNNTVLSATGLVDDAADFEDANSESLTIADASQSGLDITRDLTLIAAVKFESLGASTSIMDKDGRSGSTGYSIGKAGTGEFDFQVQGTQLKMSTSPSAGTWYHVAGAYTGAKLQGYRDGGPDGSSSHTTNPADNATAFAIGKRGDASSEYFDGLIDEALIFARYLRDEEVKVIYNRSLNGTPATFEISASEDGGGMLMAVG